METLSAKTYESLLSLFKEIIRYIDANDSLPENYEIWKREPYKRSDLGELAKIKIGMSKQEIEKRIKATYYLGKPAPFIEILSHKFEYNPER